MSAGSLLREIRKGETRIAVLQRDFTLTTETRNELIDAWRASLLKWKRQLTDVDALS
jgi:hypothetical protein